MDWDCVFIILKHVGGDPTENLISWDMLFALQCISKHKVMKTNFGTSGPCLTSNVTWAPVTATVNYCPHYDISPVLCPWGSLLRPFQPPHSGRASTVYQPDWHPGMPQARRPAGESLQCAAAMQLSSLRSWHGLASNPLLPPPAPEGRVISKVGSAYKCKICNKWTSAYLTYKTCIFLHIFSAYFLHIWLIQSIYLHI